MTHSRRDADMLGSVAGVVFAILLFATVWAVNPQRGVSDATLLDWWASDGNRSGFVISMYTLLAACPLLLLFVVRLRRRLSTAESGDWADLLLAAGAVMTAALGFTAIIRGVIASSMRFADEPLPGVDTLRFGTDLMFAAWDVVILFAAVLTAVASGLVLATRRMPRWIAALGLLVSVVSLALLAAQVASLAIPLVIVWVIANSVVLWRASAPLPAPAGEPGWPAERAHSQA